MSEYKRFIAINSKSLAFGGPGGVKQIRWDWFELERARFKGHCSIGLVSRNEDEPYSLFKLWAFDWYLRVKLPKRLIPAIVEERQYQGRKYIEIVPREYSITSHEEYIHLCFGRNEFADNTHNREMSIALPWRQWRRTRHTYYNRDGDVQYEMLFPRDRKEGRDIWKEAHRNVEKIRFAFLDFDDERIIATCFVNEREWRKGEKPFKWLSRFVQPKIRRDLDLRFSAEVGERKGSWKGGTTGHSIEMLPGESPESAFKRYCGKHGLTFLNEVGIDASISAHFKRLQLSELAECVDLTDGIAKVDFVGGRYPASTVEYDADRLVLALEGLYRGDFALDGGNAQGAIDAKYEAVDA